MSNRITLRSFAASLACLIWAGILPGSAYAQILEDISLKEGKGVVVATIRLAGPVQYLKHFPAQKGQFLEVFYTNLSESFSIDQGAGDEILKSPPSTLIPSFTVKTRALHVKPELVIEFSREVEYSVAAGKDGRSFEIAIQPRKQGETEGGVPVLPELPDVEQKKINQQAAVQMVASREAFIRKDYAAAIAALTNVLLLPENKYTQDAQEWIGVARERIGQTDKARLEYEHYLALYNSGEGVASVRKRLAMLNERERKLATVTPAVPVTPSASAVAAETPAPTIAPSSPVAATVPAAPMAIVAQPVAVERIPEKEAKPAQTTLYGSLSMYYYHGASQTDTTTQAAIGNTLANSSFTLEDQSSVLTNVFLSERYRSDEYDNRIVFQDTYNANFLAGKKSSNRLGSAFVEIKNRKSNYSGRFGRQSPTGGGVMGRFDGAALGYGLSHNVRVNAVAGQLADLSLGPQPQFFGTSVDMGNVSVYAINQTIEGIVDRRAIGTEIRYFEQNRSAFAMLDYNTIYSTLSTAFVQGTFGSGADGGATFNFLLDHRKNPPLSTRNALIGASTTSVQDLLTIMTETDLRELARLRATTSNMGQLGVVYPFKEKWQIGGDIRVSNISEMEASGTTALEGILPATPGTGNEFTYTAQLIGSNLYTTQDVSSMSLSYVTSEAITGKSVLVYTHANIYEFWMADLSFRWYQQSDQFGGELSRTAPTLKLGYKVKEGVNLEVEGGQEMTKSSSTGQTAETSRQFYSLGFRWDF